MLWLVLGQACQADLQVEGRPRWGFDGRVRLGRFNLLSIDVRNDSDRPWTGQAQVEPMMGLVGADMPVIQQNLFIEPYGLRRLQFLLFVPRTTEYEFRWGRETRERFTIDEPPIADGTAEVQFISGSSLSAGLPGLLSFDEADFPYSANGLETLGAVHLDHVPGWSEPQARAFLDWLKSGGTLFLHGKPGEPAMNFQGALSELGQPSGEFPLGAGMVRRVDAARWSPPLPAASGQPSMRYPVWEPTQSTFQLLKSMTQPHHNWVLIYLLAVIYLLLLFPGCWLLGRRKGDYRLTYGVLVGIVFVFSVGFRTVGARGYGERTAVNSVALARVAGPQRLLVTQWTNLFVTSGDNCEIKHQTEGSAYSSGQLNEHIPGVILNRPQGAMITDIPSFSSRTFLESGVLPAAAPRFEIESYELENDRLKSLKLTFADESLWKEDSAFRGWALHGQSLYHLSQNGRTLTAQGPVMLKSVLDSNEWAYNRFRFNDQDAESAPQIYEILYGPIIAYDLGLKSDDERDRFELPAGTIRIYLYARMPEKFEIQGNQFHQQNGRVMYAVTLHPE
jgi:hypothetical protein